MKGLVRKLSSKSGNNQTEKYILESIGAKPIKNSGRGLKKGDGILEKGNIKFTVDVKEGKSFSLNPFTWSKHVSDAIRNHSEPMILAALSDGNVNTKLVIIELDTFMELINDKS